MCSCDHGWTAWSILEKVQRFLTKNITWKVSLTNIFDLTDEPMNHHVWRGLDESHETGTTAVNFRKYEQNSLRQLRYYKDTPVRGVVSLLSAMVASFTCTVEKLVCA